MVVYFLKGSRRLNLPSHLLVPTWDLSTVLRALRTPPFELLQSGLQSVPKGRPATSFTISQASRRLTGALQEPYLP